MSNPTLPRVNPWPKDRFQLSGDNVSKHRDLIDSREFERGADFSLQQYATFLGNNVTDNNQALAAGWMLKGATDFLATFRMLSEKPQPLPKVLPPNLDHQA